MMTTMIYDEYCNVLYRQLFAGILSCENQKSNVKVVVNSVCAAANVFSSERVCARRCGCVLGTLTQTIERYTRPDESSCCVLSQLDHNML